MVKFTAKNPVTGNTIIGLGLSSLNCKRLLEGKPISIDGRTQLNLSFPIEILILAGEDETSITSELEKNGFSLPQDPDKIYIDPKLKG